MFSGLPLAPLPLRLWTSAEPWNGDADALALEVETAGTNACTSWTAQRATAAAAAIWQQELLLVSRIVRLPRSSPNLRGRPDTSSKMRPLRVVCAAGSAYVSRESGGWLQG